MGTLRVVIWPQKAGGTGAISIFLWLKGRIGVEIEMEGGFPGPTPGCGTVSGLMDLEAGAVGPE